MHLLEMSDGSTFDMRISPMSTVLWALELSANKVRVWNALLSADFVWGDFSVVARGARVVKVRVGGYILDSRARVIGPASERRGAGGGEVGSVG